MIWCKSDDGDNDGYMFLKLPGNGHNELRGASKFDDCDNDLYMINGPPANEHNEPRRASNEAVLVRVPRHVFCDMEGHTRDTG